MREGPAHRYRVTVRSLAGCASAASQAATSATRTTTVATATGSATGATRIVVWSVNSDGPDFRAILTGAVGDYGPAVTVLPNGTVEPEHTSEMELKLVCWGARRSLRAA